MALDHFDQLKSSLFHHATDSLINLSAKDRPTHTSPSHLQGAFRKLYSQSIPTVNQLEELPFLISQGHMAMWNKETDPLFNTMLESETKQVSHHGVQLPLSRTQSSPTSFGTEFSSGVSSYLSLFSATGINSDASHNDLSDLLKNFTPHRSASQLSHATTLSNYVPNAQITQSSSSSSLGSQHPGPTSQSRSIFLDSVSNFSSPNRELLNDQQRVSANFHDEISDYATPLSEEEFTQKQYWNPLDVIEDIQTDWPLFNPVSNQTVSLMPDRKFEGGSTSISTDEITSSRDLNDLAPLSGAASSSVWSRNKSPRYGQKSPIEPQENSRPGSFFAGAVQNGERGAQFTLIANVPHDTVRQDLVMEFRKYGRVQLAMVVCDEASRHPHKEWTSTAGYAFVRFSKREEAAAAIHAAAMGLITIRGTRVRADWARKDSYAKRGRVSAAQGAPITKDSSRGTDQQQSLEREMGQTSKQDSLNQPSISYGTDSCDLATSKRGTTIETRPLSRFTSCSTTFPPTGSTIDSDMTLQRAQSVDCCPPNNDLLLQLDQALSIMIGQLGEEQQAGMNYPAINSYSALESEKAKNWTSLQGFSRLVSADARCGDRTNELMGLGHWRKDNVMGPWPITESKSNTNEYDSRCNFERYHQQHDGNRRMQQQHNGLGVFSGADDEIFWAENNGPGTATTTTTTITTTTTTTGNYSDSDTCCSALHSLPDTSRRVGAMHGESRQYRDLRDFDDYLSPCSKGLLVVALRDVAGCPQNQSLHGLDKCGTSQQRRESPGELLRRAVENHEKAASC